MFIALTGGIGCGKSTALEYFKQCQYNCSDADRICHKFYESSEAVAALQKRWPSVLDEQNKLDRQKLANIVFRDENELAVLEQLIAPFLHDQLQQLKNSSGNIVVEVPLLFEKDLAALGVVALTAFIPMLMGTGGNAGGQSSVTVIRGLATGELELSDVIRIMWKETRVSVLCALTLSIVGFIKIILIDNLIFKNAVPLEAAAVVCIALAATVIVAKLVGCTLPLLAKLCKLDPAVMASPFITTIVDAISLLIYFRVALLILT